MMILAEKKKHRIKMLKENVQVENKKNDEFL
jgi:hypothetical protein